MPEQRDRPPDLCGTEWGVWGLGEVPCAQVEPRETGSGLTLHTRATLGIINLETNSYSTDTSVKKK